MAVDRNALIQELEQYGNVVFCDINNIISYVVVMSDWTSDEATFEAIANIYIIPDYPYLYNFTLLHLNNAVRTNFLLQQY